MSEGNFEAQRVICDLLPWDFLDFLKALEVLYVRSTSMPSDSRLFDCLLRVDKWFHAMVIGWISFVKVYDVECVLLIFASIWNSEVEPLSHELIKRLEVRTQFQIVDELANLSRPPEVARLESTFKDESGISWAS